jgi:hypothetical protein
MNMSDLVGRLEKEAVGWDNDLEGVLNEAAARITALEQEVATLRGAMTPFVEAFKLARETYAERYKHSDKNIGYRNFDKMPDDWMIESLRFNMRSFRRAATALTPQQKKATP